MAAILGFRMAAGTPVGGPGFVGNLIVRAVIIGLSVLPLLSHCCSWASNIGGALGAVAALHGMWSIFFSWGSYDLGPGQTSWIETGAVPAALGIEAAALLVILVSLLVHLSSSSERISRVARWLIPSAVLVGSAVYWAGQILIGYDLSYLR